jgi:hypothetical protein
MELILKIKIPKFILQDKNTTQCHDFGASCLRAQPSTQNHLMYSHMLQNDILVNDGPHIQQWSHNIIIQHYNIIVLQYYNIIYSINVL